VLNLEVPYRRPSNRSILIMPGVQPPCKCWMAWWPERATICHSDTTGCDFFRHDMFIALMELQQIVRKYLVTLTLQSQSAGSQFVLLFSNHVAQVIPSTLPPRTVIHHVRSREWRSRSSSHSQVRMAIKPILHSTSNQHLLLLCVSGDAVDCHSHLRMG